MSCRGRKRLSSHSFLQEPTIMDQPWLPDRIAHLKKEKWWYLHPKSEEHMGEAASAIVVIENPTDVNVISSRNIGQWAFLSVAAVTTVTLIADCFSPGTFTNQIKGSFRVLHLLAVIDSRLTTSRSQRCFRSTCRLSLCVRHICHISIYILLSLATREPTQWRWCVGCWLRKFSVCAISCVHPWEVRPTLYFYHTLGRMRSKDKQLLKRLWARRNVKPNRQYWLLGSLL